MSGRKRITLPRSNWRTLAIRLNHSPPCWMQRHHFLRESEATCVRKKSSWLSLRVRLRFLQSFGTAIWWTYSRSQTLLSKKIASENLPVKATLTRGYKFFHESYVHDVEGKLPAVICIEHHGAIIIIGAFFSNPSLESGQMELNFFSFFTVKLANEEEGVTVRVKCFRSMKKNQAPNRLTTAVVLDFSHSF